MNDDVEPRGIAAVVIAVMLAVSLIACDGSSDPVASPSVVTVTASPTAGPAAEPEPRLATIRGPFNGNCILVKRVGFSIDSIPKGPAHWKFHPQGDRKVVLVSKSGGYTGTRVELDRTTPTKFYGTTTQGFGWLFAYAIKIANSDTDGEARVLEVITHDIAPGGVAKL